MIIKPKKMEIKILLLKFLMRLINVNNAKQLIFFPLMIISANYANLIFAFKFPNPPHF